MNTKIFGTTQRYAFHYPYSLWSVVKALEFDYNSKKRRVQNITKTVLTLLSEMVGATGFEPATSWTPFKFHEHQRSYICY